MKKRLLSMLLVLVMVIGLLPTAAMAAVSPEVSAMTTTGYYQDAEWVAGVQTPQPELPEGIVAVNKTAEPVEGSTNVYNITLTVETKTSQTTIDANAATTLVLDVSGSMTEDIQVGDGKNDLALLDTVYGAGEGIYKMRIADHWGVVRTYDLRFYNGAWQYDKIIGGWTNLIGSGYEDNAKAIYITRINALKIAAKNFVDSYSNQTADRWLSIVKFADRASEQLAWTNVSTESGANAAKAAIDGLSANGGTNLDDGLRQASAKMDESTVRSIPAKNKYVIALSDGEPTFYINEKGNVAGDGGYMDKATEAATIKTATALKNSNKINKLYTICFDGGDTATEILQKVASTPSDAYTAKNASDLSFIIDKLGETINSGTTGEGLVVTDPMAEYVTVTGTLPEGFVKGTGDTYTWTLANAQQFGTHYLYTITYQIVIDADDPNFVEDQFYPTNRPTYLTYGEETVYFPVPGVKGVKTDYTVVYDLDGGVSTTTGAVDGKYTYTGLHNGDTTPVIAEPTKAGYNFVKWTPTVSDKVNGDDAVNGIITYTAVWELIPTYTLTYDENGGVGGPDDVKGLTAQTGYALATSPVPTHDAEDDVRVVFIGWTAAKDEKIYAKNETAPTCITTVDINADTTVYAVYGYDTNDDGIPDVLQNWVTVTKIFKGITAEQVETLTSFKLLVANSDLVVKTLTLDGATLDPKEKNPTYTWEFPLATGNYIISESRKDVKLEPYTLTVKDADKKIISVGVDVFTQNFTVEENGTSSIVFQNAYTPKNTFTLTYDANGGTGAPDAESTTVAKESVEFTVSTTEPTREGYTFLGWNENKDATTAQNFTENKITVTAADGYSKTLYAVWSRDKGTLTVTKTFTGLDAGEKLPDVTITVKNATGTVVATLTNKDATGFTASTDTYTWTVTVPTDTYTVEETAVPAIPGYLVNEKESTVKAENVSVTLNGGSARLTNAYTKETYGLEVSKTVSSKTAKAGDTLTYTIKVKNAGNVARTNVAVKDTMTGAKGTISFTDTANVTYSNGVFTIKNLAVDATETITYTYKVLEADKGATIRNGVEVENDITEKDDNTEVLVENGALKVVKTVDKTTAKVGDKLTYTITVTNTGNTTLYRVELTDAMLNVTETIGMLERGTSWTKSYEYTVKTADAGKTIVNTAVAKASDGTTGSGSSEGTKVQSTQIHVPTLNKKDHVAYIIGYEDNTVRPENNITRAEVATIFFRLLTDDSRARFWSQTNDFSDVSANDWFNNAVSTMANAGVLTGYPDGTFKPNAPITRAEFAAIAARFSDVTYNGKCSFTDVAATYWAADEIALAEHLGWITGYPDDTFRPGRNITRAEAMTLINRVLERAVEEEDMLKNMVKWIDNSPSAWYYEAVQEATNSHTYTRLSKKVPGQSFYYEDWVAILENPDWAALERAWSKANDQ